MADRVRISIGLPTDRVSSGDEFLTVDSVAAMARHIEDCGFDACYVTDHPFPPDRWLAAGGHHALDPFVALAVAAGATRRLRLQTNMIVAGYRNPFITAKAVASLDRLSGGRVILGLAAGYLRREFGVVGADFESRGNAVEDAIRSMRSAWTGESVEGHTMLPTPASPEGPPIWIGGNSRAAIRRAVTMAEGWVPFPTPPGTATAFRTGAIETPADLAARIEFAEELGTEAGRAVPLDVCAVPFTAVMGQEADLPAVAAEVGSLSEIGVTWAALSIPGATRAEFSQGVEHLAELLR